MAYKDENTDWMFTVPQAGEVDSAESVAKAMSEIDGALIGPMRKAELLSNGRRLNAATYPDGDESTYSSEPDWYWSEVEGRPVYTTKSHYHPMPSFVPGAKTAASAVNAQNADMARKASELSPGFRLNGKDVTGRAGQDVVLTVSDIPDAPRVFWGMSHPNQAQLPSLRSGDIYIQIV